MSVRLLYDRVDKYLVHASLASPMHVGSGDNSKQGILIHPTTRTPFIQASSLTGVMRDYYERQFGNAEKLFGSGDDENEHVLIKIYDGIFTDQSSLFMEFRPRVKIDPSSGSVSSSKIMGTESVSGHKFDMEYLGTGAKFLFVVYIYRDKNFDLKMEDQIMDTFAALGNGEIVLGGQKSCGCGDINIDHLYYKSFDLREDKDRLAWMHEDELKENDYVDIADKLSKQIKSIYRIRVIGEIENSVLVKGYHLDSFGPGAPDAVNIRNSNGDYIIPGSSIKGTLRSRVSYIAKNLHLEKDCIDEIFGSSESDENGIPGNTRFYDTIIGSKEENDKNDISHRTHIDKFTGGVFYKALFSEKSAFGSINAIKFDVAKKNNPEKAVGLLILAGRDLANGLYNLGGGYSIGHGFMNVDRIEIGCGESTTVINFKDNETTDPDNLIDKCLEAVKNAKGQEETHEN